jgi:hypothetical protein
MPNKPGAGRPRTKDGKRVNVYLSKKTLAYLSQFDNQSEILDQLVREKMNTIDIIIKTNEEGFLGSTDDEERAKIDVEKSYNLYCKKVLVELKIAYPDCNVEMPYENYAGPSIKISADPEQWDVDLVSDTVQDICGRIYDAGDFWEAK